MTILLSQPHLTIERYMTLNPSTLLLTAEDGIKHDCLTEIQSKVLPRKDLKDTQLADNDLILFVDGSCKKKNPDGTHASGYAVVTLTLILEVGKLSSHYSEFVALTRACTLSRYHLHRQPVCIFNLPCICATVEK